LVVAGGNPDLHKMIALCPEGSPKPGCAELRKNEIPTPTFAHDHRVKALVTANPAFGPLFDPDGLKDVKITIQLWASALSVEGPAAKSRWIMCQRFYATCRSSPIFMWCRMPVISSSLRPARRSW
jgi:hypothetical protein